MAAPFDALIITPPAPASTSDESSSEMKHLPYDVFINHHGGDVKHTVANTIYNKLDATGLRVFLDKNELNLGDFFPGALEEAMGTASVRIAIFSENYAHSPWCLAELAFMLRTSVKFIPIFYHVEPCTLRWAIEGKGIYAEAFSKHEMKNRYTSKQLQNWKLALHKASFYNGEIINNQGDEEKAVKNVVESVLKELEKVVLDVAKHPVGLDEVEQDFNAKIALQSAGPIQIVGIYGMGGVGKTTFAKQLYNKKYFTIGKSSFLSDVREAERLHKKQKELLKDLDLESRDFKNVDEGKEILKSCLKSVSVLIVLDDVDHTDQLDALLPARESLGHGSLIIVTTRELSVLKAGSISTTYKMRTLNNTHAGQLFCWHAFGQPSPFLGFEDLAKSFINACHGLPLSLKVIGGSLRGEYSQKYWQSQLDKLSRIVPDDIKLRLKISYDGLDKEEKEMFLDIACFFIGWPSSRAIAVWDGSEWNGLHGWQRLVNKCLVGLDQNNAITMHDHLRDLGREIANQQSPYRLWSERQIIEIRPQQEAVRIRGMSNAFGDNCFTRRGKIIINTSQGERILAPGSLGLKIFVGNGDFINEEYSELLRELVCLFCNGFQHKNLPSWLSLKKLRVLLLSCPWRLECLWEHDADAPLQLRELFIFMARNLEKIESLDSLRSLETLSILDCTELNTLPSLAEATSLKCIDLRRCNKLEKIESLESLRSLETLRIVDCTELNTLPSLAEATSLKCIDLRHCNKLEKIESLESLRSLETLGILDCTELNTLPSLAEATSLKCIDLIRCNKLEKIESLESLRSLETLSILDCTELNTLPSLAEATFLREIYLEYCSKLKQVKNLKGLRSLDTLKIDNCPQLDGLPSLAELTSLKKFGLSKCHKLEKIEGLESLRSLETFSIEDCPALDTLPSFAELTSLEEFKLKKCHKLLKIEDLERSTSLKKFEVHVVSKGPFTVSLEHRERLKSLVVVANDRLVVEPFISNIQKWPREVIICTMAVSDVSFWKNFFTSLPLKNVVEFGLLGGITFSLRESTANAILICFIIDYVYPNLLLQICTDRGNHFYAEITNGKWLWMGIFPQGSNWLQSERYEIRAFSEDKEVKVKEAWLVMGKEGSIVEAFHQLSQRKHEDQLMAVQNDAAAEFDLPDTAVVQPFLPRIKRNREDDLEVTSCQDLSPASDPNKRRKLIKVLGEDGLEQGGA